MKNGIDLRSLFKDRYVLDQTLQRAYEWGTDRVVNLINDIRTIQYDSVGGGKCHYNIGDFITYEKGVDDFKFLCDGQQRLTTLVLLFANILHRHPSSPKIKNTLNGMLYKTTLDEDGLEEKVKVLTLKNCDNTILSKIIESGVEGLTKEEKKSHLVKVYNKITDEFTKNMTGDELDDFFLSIYQNASYFERECESQGEAIKQFNNLNGGQQSISKSHVGITTLYGIYNQRGHADPDSERLLFELSNMDIKRQTDFLFLYIYYRADECKATHIPSVINKLNKKIKNILSDIVRFYNDVFVKEIEQSKGYFMKQTSMRQIYVDLYTDKYPRLKDVDLADKELAQRKCEWGYICNRIKRGGNGEATLFHELFKGYNKDYGQLSQYVEDKLKAKGLWEPVEIVNTNRNHTSHNNELFVRLLLTVEYEFEKERGNKEPVNHCSKPSLEHIHPQRMRPDEVYLCDESVVNRFGNMTIIGDNANKSLSNKNFLGKRELYENSPYFINSKKLCKFEKWDNASVEENEKFYYGLLRTYYGLGQCDCGTTERKADVAMDQDAKITE